MAKFYAAVLGCGAIFSRHLAALNANSDNFKFIGFYDPKPEVMARWRQKLGSQKTYASEDQVYLDSEVNCVIILTPSYLHFAQAKRALQHHKHVIVEKPASFIAEQINELEQLAHGLNLEIFCVLQVRLNQSIAIAKAVLAGGLLGEIRSSSLVQRWQRPLHYFSAWRSTYAGCGGVLNEFGIHYLDIMQYLLGLPKVMAASFYNTKFKNSKISDSVYALLDFGGFGGTMEISLVAEPRNIEVSLIIMGSHGFIKLGGKSLDQINAAEFSSPELRNYYADICVEVVGQKIENQIDIGVCPHHPELYKQIIYNKQLFELHNTYNVIKLVSEINNLEHVAG